MSSLKPQSKRDEFRKYLEKAGVMDALTRVLVSLYEEPERPANAIEYFLNHLGSGIPMRVELESLQTEVGDLQTKISELEGENDRLRKRLEAFETTQSANWGDDQSATGGSEAVANTDQETQ